MKPDKPGVWEWFKEDGERCLVEVYDVNTYLKKTFPDIEPYLRVAWAGGYYNVNDEHDPENPQYDHLMKAEWPDRWGTWVAPNGAIPEKWLYLVPTAAERERYGEK